MSSKASPTSDKPAETTPVVEPAAAAPASTPDATPPADNAPSPGAQDEKSGLMAAILDVVPVEDDPDEFDPMAPPAEDAGATSDPDPSKSGDPPAKEAAKPEDAEAAAKGKAKPEDAKAAAKGEAKPEDAEAAAKGEDDADAAEGGDAEDAPLGELTDAELDSYKPRVQKRIKHLLGQIDALKEDAGKHQQFVQFLETNQLTPDDTKLLLGAGVALRRGDFATFLQAVEPYVQLAREATGAALPPDLQQQVDDGYITRELAAEVAQSRHAAQRARNEAVTASQRANQTTAAAQEQRRADLARQVHSTIASWETKTRASDPDYDAKADAVTRYVRAAVAEKGLPTTPEQAIEIANAAYAEVNTLLGQAKPKPKPTRPTPSGVSTTGTPVQSAPRTLEEAAYAGLRAAQAAGG